LRTDFSIPSTAVGACKCTVVNAFLLPIVVIFLVMLAISVLPHPRRLRGWYLGLVVAAATVTCIAGIGGAVYGLL